MVHKRLDLYEKIKVDASVIKKSKISSDGRNLLVRIPKEIQEFLEIKKGDSLAWKVDNNTKEMIIEVLRDE